MDALFFLKHSQAEDLEIRFALRSIHRHAPWIRKIWIFGDRPQFLTDDTSFVQHVPHQYAARIGPFRTPVTNTFLLFYLSSLIPELSFEYLWFTDDSILIQDLSPELARLDLYLEDMTQVKVRGQGAYKEMLWRTFDLLKRLGYPGYNFDTHTPQYYNKKRVLEAYCDLKDYVTEDRYWGIAGSMAIPNHALRQGDFRLTHLGNRCAGFYDRAPDYSQVVAGTQGRMYLNFDDAAFGEGVRQFLFERFPDPSPFEKNETTQVAVNSGLLDASANADREQKSKTVVKEDTAKKSLGLLAKKRHS